MTVIVLTIWQGLPVDDLYGLLYTRSRMMVWSAQKYFALRMGADEQAGAVRLNLMQTFQAASRGQRVVTPDGDRLTPR